MPEPTETTETTETTPEAPESTLTAPDAETTPEPAPDADEAHDERPARDAARYRRQLREVEAEREALRGQLDALRRAQVVSIVKAERRFGGPDLLDAAGVPMADLLDDAGAVDTAKVLAALDDAGRRLGVSTKLPAAPSADGQGRGTRSIYDGNPAPSFADAFRPR